MTGNKEKNGVYFVFLFREHILEKSRENGTIFLNL